jgi:hypothetical protein
MQIAVIRLPPMAAGLAQCRPFSGFLGSAIKKASVSDNLFGVDPPPDVLDFDGCYQVIVLHRKHSFTGLWLIVWERA